MPFIRPLYAALSLFHVLVTQCEKVFGAENKHSRYFWLQHVSTTLFPFSPWSQTKNNNTDVRRTAQFTHPHQCTQQGQTQAHCLNRAALLTPQGVCVCVCVCVCEWGGGGRRHTHMITQMLIVSYTNVTFIQSKYVCVCVCVLNGGRFLKQRALTPCNAGFTLYSLPPHYQNNRSLDSPHSPPTNCEMFCSFLTFLKYLKTFYFQTIHTF